jgi:integrase/recombinase XerD
MLRDFDCVARSVLPRSIRGRVKATRTARMVRAYSAALGFKIGAHALRATAATNALDHQADLAKVQDWAWSCQYCHHANLRPPCMRPEDSPTFKVAY